MDIADFLKDQMTVYYYNEIESRLKIEKARATKKLRKRSDY